MDNVLQVNVFIARFQAGNAYKRIWKKKETGVEITLALEYMPKPHGEL